ncbi:hypothetical protein J7T55_002087 [Diaporthe amygdali]|uniref:uncharacterized protein n=1 Tax=Phomopsis amygdali TaxID=1214568 RepID=UPI0022FEF706|nr:uncharacterized protein J7T55_002087 [Diaporthe amygdali]KAJ0108483.1 hypothetical protein J7T55_002087 [Diaporthe amygdali]
MANGLDRLERLFSKRKSAPARDTTASNINGSAPPASAQPEPDSPLQETTFPPPSFIRPKANRMHARDEFELPSPISVARASSSDSARNSRRLSHLDTRDMNDKRRRSGPSTTAAFHLPSRTSSLLARRHDRKPGGPIQLHLPGGTTSTDKPTSHSSQSPSADTTATKSEDQKVAQRHLLEALPIYPAVKVETPPASDQDEFNFPSPPSSTRGRLPPAILSPFTPEPSPDMIPQRDSVLSEPKTSSDLRRASISTVPSRRATVATISSTALLDDDWRDSYIHDPQITASPKSETVFQEPRVQDFLALTADDLAEVRTKVPSNPPLRLPPPPPVLPPGMRSPPFSPSRRGSNMLGPLAPDEVAAFQAARIAKKYDFDFLYVVNFWPKEMLHLHRPSETLRHSSIPSTALSSPTSSFSKPPSILYSPISECPTTKNSTPRHSLQAPPSEASSNDYHHIADCCPESAGPGPRTAMAGRLLAAYGLNTLDGPFRAGTRAHRKILREGTDGWIEYRKSDAQDNEFARGYARSYYTASDEDEQGGSPRRASAPESGKSAAASASASRLVTQMEGAISVRQSFSSAVAAGKAAAGTRNSAQKGARVNRGIVFAAYRRPRSHGGTVHSSRAELDALEREAQALVDLVLDFHQDRRRWQVYQEARRASAD